MYEGEKWRRRRKGKKVLLDEGWREEIEERGSSIRENMRESYGERIGFKEGKCE